MFVYGVLFRQSGKHFLVLVITSVLTTLTCSNEITESTIVYPHVYEDREEASEKVLVIQDGYSINLKKASVLAENLLLQDIRDEGISETYVKGAFYERHLYQDVKREASLIVKPGGNGHYDVTGLLNFTHRIEPDENMARSLSGARAHKISKIPFKDGIHRIAEALEDKVGMSAMAPHTEKRAFLDSVTIEVFYISDYEHTRHFWNRPEERIQYAAILMHSVSLRTQQLYTPAFIALTAIAGSFTTNESYVKLLGPNQLIGNETLFSLSKYMWANYTMRIADVVYLVTARDMIDVLPRGISTGVLGMAYRGKACSRYQVAAGEDKPGMLSGINTAAHEIGHLLGSDHDGYGTSSSCSDKDGYLMSPRAGGKNNFLFSNCSKNEIDSFMGSFDAYCLEFDWSKHIAFFPNATAKLPGALINGAQYCAFYFRGKRNVTYIKWDSDLSKCKFRCQIGWKQNGQPDYAIRTALDGTPCNRSSPSMVCRNTVCG
uniref:Putative tick metalloprotease 1 n=1 Tax=Amblyomma cajennense TaxID=34607 RepID=A0A023FUM2_AMBCJ